MYGQRGASSQKNAFGLITPETAGGSGPFTIHRIQVDVARKQTRIRFPLHQHALEPMVMVLES